MECNTGKVINLGSLYARFQELTDTRKSKGEAICIGDGFAGAVFSEVVWGR